MATQSWTVRAARMLLGSGPRKKHVRPLRRNPRLVVEGLEERTLLATVDLTMVKTDSADPVIAGNSFSYTLDIDNNGADATIDATVSDTLPAGLTFNAGGSTGGCLAVGQLVTCIILAADLEFFDAPVSITIAVDVDSSVADGTVLSNTATVAEGAGDTDSDPTNNDDTETTTVNREADLSITKTESADPVIAGTTFSYSINVTNSGPSDASGVTVSDTLPAGLTFSSGGSSIGCSAVGQAVTCTVGLLANGGVAPLTIEVDLASSVADNAVISNTATVAGNETDPTSGNDSDTETTNVDREADLSILKVESTDPVTAGGSFSYAIHVTNNGPSDASGVTVSDTLPAGLTFHAAGSSAGCSAVGQVVTCTVGTITNGSQSLVTIVVDVAASVASGAVISNTATVDGNETDPTPGNDSSTENTNVVRSSDLAVVKTESADPVIAGASFSYSIQVTNNGPSNATGVTVSDTLPAELTFHPAGSSGSCSAVGQVVTCTIGALGATSNTTVTVVVDVASSVATGTIITNTATVDGNEPDPTAANDSESETTTVNRQADLAITKSDSAEPVIAGTSFFYTLLATNNGPSDASGITVSDTLPAGLTFHATGSSPSCSAVGQAVTCTAATIAGGAQTSFTVIVDVAASVAHGTVVSNTASVDGTEPDPTAANDSDTEPTTINRSADISITKTESVDPAIAGGSLSYTVQVTNNGPSDATGVTVTDVLPAGLTFTSTGSSVGCSAVGQTVTCTIGALANAAQSSAVIAVNVASSVAHASVISNTATVAATENDATPGNNSSTETTTVNRRVDLVVTKTESADPVRAGSGVGNLTYIVTVTNNGPSDASGVTVGEDITLPTGVTVVSVTPSVGTFVNTTAPDGTWTIATLANGASATLTVVLTAGATATTGTDTISDTATITGANETLILTTNDSDSESTSVVGNCSAVVVTDPTAPTQNMLVVSGSATKDKITIGKPKNGQTPVKSKSGCVLNTSFVSTGFARIVIFGGGGDDTISMSKSPTPGAIFGEAGNDTMTGGTSSNVLIGGSGDDKITGGNARDLIIGGTGADKIKAKNFEDIVAAGNSDHDANGAALAAIIAEWVSNAPYATRVSHLTGATAGGLNGSFVLNSTTVHDDNQIDVLTGGKDTDWFLANTTGTGARDNLKDDVAGETITDI
jgi:uncharacterized repeat protein (TIGR01451 family)